MKDVILVGAGQSADQCATILRREGFDGSILIVGEENHPPYQRPPLSKDYLAGKVDLDRVYSKKIEFYAKQKIDLLLSTRVKKINRKDKSILLSNSDKLSYKKLVLATGSRVRKLHVTGSCLSNIHYLRNINDSENIKKHIKKDKKLVIVGAGYIGLEVAAVAAGKGMFVSVIEMEQRVMNRTVDPIISKYFEDLHKQHGVKIFLNTALKKFSGSNLVSKVICSNGLELEADLVVVGAGILPNIELALDAGLECENGIIVDEYGKTGDSDIYACGDCTNHPNKILGKRLRLESVHNALEQAKTVASSIYGRKKEYSQVPWFWSDQYDHKLQIVGLAGKHQEVVKRGSEEEKAFLLFYLKNKELIAVDAVNSPKEFLDCKKLVANRIKISSDTIQDLSVKLSELLK